MNKEHINRLLELSFADLQINALKFGADKVTTYIITSTIRSNFLNVVVEFNLSGADYDDLELWVDTVVKAMHDRNNQYISKNNTQAFIDIKSITLESMKETLNLPELKRLEEDLKTIKGDNYD